jgi:hypothetical protein
MVSKKIVPMFFTVDEMALKGKKEHIYLHRVIGAAVYSLWLPISAIIYFLFL